MAFMQPYYSRAVFVEIENEQGESNLVPEGYEDLQPGEKITERHVGKVFCRLSAPGYVDCTEWSGPFDSVDKAKAHIRDTYDVDPETGDELDDPACQCVEPGCPKCDEDGHA